MADVLKFEVDPGKALQKAIDEALKSVSDLTIPYTLIAKDWFKSNRAIFTLKGPGKYVDLSEKYKIQKQKAVGFVYPILKRSGLLEESITKPEDSNSINLIINKTTLILGTSVSYAAVHQTGTEDGSIPKRPIIFTDGEQSSPDDQFNRSGAWEQILKTYVLEVSKQVGSVSE